MAHKILSIWSPGLPVFPRAQSASFLLSALSSFQGVLKVSSCSSTWVNPCGGRWRVPICNRQRNRLEFAGVTDWGSAFGKGAEGQRRSYAGQPGLTPGQGNWAFLVIHSFSAVKGLGGGWSSALWERNQCKEDQKGHGGFSCSSSNTCPCLGFLCGEKRETGLGDISDMYLLSNECNCNSSI